MRIKPSLIHSSFLRYIFFGCCTTMINLSCFFLLRRVFQIYRPLANGIAISIAILFAFFVNQIFVFHFHPNTWKERLQVSLRFLSSRFFSFLLEIILLECFVFLSREEPLERMSFLSISEVIGKIGTQVVIILLNYWLSNHWIFFKKTDLLNKKNTSIKEIDFNI